MNPLFASDDEDYKKPKRDAGYVLPNRHGKKIQPISKDLHAGHSHPASRNHAAETSHQSSEKEQPKPDAEPGSVQAIELIRRKLENLYEEEPNASAEQAAVAGEPAPSRSPHQQFMYDLSTSGRSLAEIQTAWHEYYARLSDEEKHQVWQEFYSNTGRQQQIASPQPRPQPGQGAVTDTTRPNLPSVPSPVLPSRLQTRRPQPKPQEPSASRAVVSGYESFYEQSEKEKGKRAKPSLSTAKNKIKKHVKLSASAQKKAKQHAQSLLFGLATGAIVLLIVLFGLFNEVVVAPFIQPSRQAEATPIILSSDSVAPTDSPQVIIPKISVQIPTDYNLTTTDEDTFQKALESGVVHYYTTSKPGEKGNTAIFGHSSNNILNPGKYKFAFVKLNKLVPGDIFYLTYGNKVFTYRVYDKRIVPPTDISVLDPVPGKTATATLITCDPPGTSLNRLVVWGEQINPDPNTNVDTTAPADQTEQPSSITGNGPPIWERILGWFQ